MSNSGIARTMAKNRSRIIDLRKKRAGPAEGRTNIQISFPERRRSPLRARRRKLRALTALAILILIAGAVAGLSALSYLPEYSIQDVYVSGTKAVSPRMVRAYAETLLNDGTGHVLSRLNIFLYPRGRIEKGVTDYFPRIESAQVSRESMLAQAIVVQVTERKPFALWCADKCFAMDENGFIFAPLEASPRGGLSAEAGPLTGFAEATSTANAGPVFRGGIDASKNPIGQIFLPEHFRSLLGLFERLRQSGFAPEGAEAKDALDFTVSFSEGFLLRAAFKDEAQALVRNLQLALAAEPLKGKQDKLEYVDLRFGNRVYYKMK